MIARVRSLRRVVMGDPAGGGLRHLALLYDGQRERLAAVTEVTRAALGRGEAVLAVMPGGGGGDLRGDLGPDADRVSFADMRDVGRNPARLIPVIRSFLARHPGQSVCCVGESAWPSRSAAELREAAKHEALVNLAFAGSPATIVCPYDRAVLPADVLNDAERTHPELLERGRRRPSAAYVGPSWMPPGCTEALPKPPELAHCLRYCDDLRPVRALVAEAAARAGLAARRIPDLVLAVSEVAANSLRHAGGSGTLRVWHNSAEIVCQIDDRGVIAEPLAGRVRPAPGEPNGHGLWLVNQVCDLVQIRSGETGTTVRMRMDLPL